MQLGCSDVCEIIHERLLQLGFDISPDDEDHEDIINALEETTLIRDNQKVFTAIISHRHGYEVFVSLTEEGLRKQVFDYVSQWWGEWEELPEDIPKENNEAIDLYFEVQNEYYGCEWLEYSTTTL